MHHYRWTLLNPTLRKNTKRTKLFIEILDQGKRESSGIVPENSHAKEFENYKT